MAKVFYTVYLPQGRERTLLDAIRLFARPSTRHPAHITLRGPYEDYHDPRDWSAKARGQTAFVGGVGIFKNAGKTAVFLQVDAPALKALKHTPEYPDSPPHLTLYDGDSPDFAASLMAMMEARNPQFEFTATEVEPMVQGNGEYPLRALYELNDLKDFMIEPPTPTEVDEADPATRLKGIEELAGHFSRSA